MQKLNDDHPLIKMKALSKTHHGITVSLTALRSCKSCGVGEYLDLIPLLSWCESVGFNVVQLLPVNDSGINPSPYSLLSSCALHPIYLSLHALPGVAQCKNLQDSLREFACYASEDYVLYHEVLEKKLRFLKQYFHIFGKKLLKTKKVRLFLKRQRWLNGYCLYKSLQEHFHEQDPRRWPDLFSEYSSATKQALPSSVADAIDFHSMLQYLCFEQLFCVKATAAKHNILLKGDIPILISKESADVWIYKTLFNTNYNAGAPPDALNDQGQHWGFPLFAWEQMAKDDFLWWKQRLGFASHFYDIYRIDHAIGFFRIWAIPDGKKAYEGFFIPAEESAWQKQGKALLSMITHASSMIAVAEDLGLVPSGMRPVLKELGICSTKVMRWEKDDHTGKFFQPEQYPQLSLTCVSTHDTSTLAQWWQECKDDAKSLCAARGWPYANDLNPTLRFHLLQESHNTKSLFHINLLQEYLALIPSFVWQEIEKERINIPGTILDTNWTYRYRASIEEIITSSLLREKIAALLPQKL